GSRPVRGGGHPGRGPARLSRGTRDGDRTRTRRGRAPARLQRPRRKLGRGPARAMAEPIVVTPGVVVPAAALTLHTSRSSGPGGQNVNKVASKVELRVD